MYGGPKPIAHGGSFNTKRRFFEQEIQEQQKTEPKPQGEFMGKHVASQKKHTLTQAQTSLKHDKEISIGIVLICLNPVPNKPWFLRVCSRSLLKTLREKKKLLITSNFSFSHSVFYPYGKLFGHFINFESVVCTLFQFGSKICRLGKG